MPVGDSPGKLCKDAKAIIQIAFENLGGLPRLIEWANASPQNLTQFYTSIWPRIVPKDIKSEVTGADGKDLVIQLVKFADYATESEVDAKAIAPE